jgi:dienelactone hydrolase
MTIETHEIRYPAGDVEAAGMIAVPAGTAKVPGIAIFADIMGQGKQTRAWATRMADELGYLALAGCVYGGGANPADFTEGRAWLSALLQDPDTLAARAGGALAALKAHPRCSGQLGAIGFCFGGSTVLAIVRDGNPDLAAAVSFHGGLQTSKPAQKGNIPAKVLVLTGAEDPMVGHDQISAFLNEMRDAGADCQTIAYTGAVHSFTNPDADGSRMPGIMFHAPTNRRSWVAMKTHFNEVFGA